MSWPKHGVIRSTIAYDEKGWRNAKVSTYRARGDRRTPSKMRTSTRRYRRARGARRIRIMLHETAEVRQGQEQAEQAAAPVGCLS